MTSPKSKMIKRRRVEDLKDGDCGLFMNEWGSYHYKEIYLGRNNKLVYEDDNGQYTNLPVTDFVYWYSWEDIKQHLSEDFVEIPSKEFS